MVSAALLVFGLRVGDRWIALCGGASSAVVMAAVALIGGRCEGPIVRAPGQPGAGRSECAARHGRIRGASVKVGTRASGRRYPFANKKGAAKVTARTRSGTAPARSTRAG